MRLFCKGGAFVPHLLHINTAPAFRRRTGYCCSCSSSRIFRYFFIDSGSGGKVSQRLYRPIAVHTSYQGTTYMEGKERERNAWWTHVHIYLARTTRVNASMQPFCLRAVRHEPYRQSLHHLFEIWSDSLRVRVRVALTCMASGLALRLVPCSHQ